MKWKKLADLPAPLYNAYAVMQQNRIYVAGGYSPVEDAMQMVYVYELNTDHWKQLPLSDHYCGVPHIIGSRLALIGGRLPSTDKPAKKVSTFDEATQTWTSYYPDLLSARHRPGVVTYLDHVFVAGGEGASSDENAMLDDIEVLNWVENCQWNKIVLHLPRPMYNFCPIICGKSFMIIGYWVESLAIDNSVFQMLMHHTEFYSWTQLPSVVRYGSRVTPIFQCHQPVVLGGYEGELTTSDMKVYDDSDGSWKVIGSLSFARCAASAVSVNDTAIIVIGGCVKGHSRPAAMSSSLTTVELGQAELIRPSIIRF